MDALTPARTEAGAGELRDLMQHRIEHALRQRVRYRYVRPRVLRDGQGYRVESPCCSRTVDPSGGTIAIALLVPRPEADSGAGPQGNAPVQWCLYARDDARSTWVPRFEHRHVDALLDLLCVDAQRQFWR